MIPTFSSTIRRREMDAVLTCMVDEKIGPGELNGKLVQSVKDLIGCDGAVAFRSPSIAFSYAMKALGVPAGSSVMVSALAPSWHFTAVQNLGYKPIVLDVNDTDGLVSSESVADGIQSGGRILLVHETMGLVPDFESILALGVPVIEDISHSVGASYDGSVGDMCEADNSAGEKKTGMFGVYSILGLEETDSITAGGGAVLIAPHRREWIVLKKCICDAPETDILPDINSALGWVQVKEFSRNAAVRESLFSVFQSALMGGKNTTFPRGLDGRSTIWSFPVVLAGSFKDVKQYAGKKDIEIRAAYEKSVISLLDDEQAAAFVHARSLYLRCALFPLYPRLGTESAAKIAKVLGTLP